MSPPRARDFRLAHLEDFDDEALRWLVAPGDAGVDPRSLGLASQHARPALVARLAAALEGAAAREFGIGLERPVSSAEVAAAERAVVERLFWPLLYWHEPEAYEELIDGEVINPRILADLEIDGRRVCDVGAGSGRFTLHAAARAAQVIAVDAVPAMLTLLRRNLAGTAGCPVDVRRGGFLDLPVADAAVDVAVSCSAVTSRGPFGGDPALAEMQRIVRPGGQVVVIWPDRPGWFVERGFTEVQAEGGGTRRFRDPAVAERLCRDYYSEAAAQWVVAHRTAVVPYSVLGVSPPT